MLNWYAYLFVRAVEALDAWQGDIEREIAAKPDAVAPVLDELQSFIAPLTLLRPLASKLNMEFTERQLILVEVAVKQRARLADILPEIRQIQTRLTEELSKKRFLFVLDDLSNFYGQDKLFGDTAYANFPAARADIKQAGNSLAIGQPTACVFHLMRAMEVVVRKLGKRLHVAINANTTWRKITGDMDAKIKPMLNLTERQKRKKNEWEAARANLHHVGSVWRNNTMHPAPSYTPSQALDVFNATRVFMTALCEL